MGVGRRSDGPVTGARGAQPAQRERRWTGAGREGPGAGLGENGLGLYTWASPAGDELLLLSSETLAGAPEPRGPSVASRPRRPPRPRSPSP